jgi:hypothetical protein
MCVGILGRKIDLSANIVQSCCEENMRIGKFVLVLTAVIAFSASARADSSFANQLDITAHTNVAECLALPNFYEIHGCFPVTLNLVVSLEPMGFGDYVLVTGVTGTMDGVFAVSYQADPLNLVPLSPEQNYIPTFGGITNAPLDFRAAGQTWAILMDQQVAPSTYIVGDGLTSWITWNVTPVYATPEPSSLALLGLALLPLMKFRKRLEA